MDDPEEFEDLLTIYNKYPLEELIVHARVQKDYYKNTPRLETFGEAVERAKSPVCYNGDIVTAEDCTRLQEMFPTLDCIMTGRGTLKNPALAREIRGGAPASKEEIRRFHDMMYNEYCEDLSGDRNILFRMKELWSYLAPMFTNNKKYAKKIKKAEKCVVYENAVRELFGCEQLIGEVDHTVAPDTDFCISGKPQTDDRDYMLRDVTRTQGYAGTTAGKSGCSGSDSVF